jgi:hypothetical protein
MAYKKTSDTEAVSDEGDRVTLNATALVFLQGARYITVPIERKPTGEIRVLMMRMSSWMENGEPSQSEGTLNVRWLRTRITEGLAALGVKYTFDH